MFSKNHFSLYLLLICFFITPAFSKYLESKTCNECHPKIYEEHTSSMHHKASIFSDELHAKMKEKVSPMKYSCALCHTPGAKNLRGLMKGQAQPNEFEKEQRDGVSCFYCHQISKVMFTKHKGINFSSYKSGKPTFFANLENAEDSDKHKSASNEIFKNNQVCMGCHSHKLNKNDVTICSTKNEFDKTSDCLSCHMPKEIGAPTKLNAKARTEHTSHQFLGIHSKEMVKKAVKLELKQTSGNTIQLTINNRMGHDIITHPMRLKYAQTNVLREGKIIWSNFTKSPKEDKKATFFVTFKDKKGNPSLPAHSAGYKDYYNLKANDTRIVTYKLNDLKKGDTVQSQWVSYIIAPNLAKKLKIEDKKVQEAYIGAIITLDIR